MDRTANPLFKAGMAAITATALVVAPTAVPRTPQAISLPDVRSAAVRLSSFAFTPQADNAPLSALTALKFPLPSSAPGASDAPAGPLPLAPITSASLLAQPRTAAAPPVTPSITPSRSSAPVAAAAGPTVANSITNGIDQAYQFIQYWVDYGVDLAQWGAGFVPVIGGLVSAQIGIVYDNLVRPIANSFVYNLVDPIINDPSFSNIVNSFGRFGSDIVNSVINFAWAEARYFLPPLPPLPGLALQATADSVGATPTSMHEALAPFTKAFKDAQAHFAETLGLTKADQKLAGLEKTGTTAETTTETINGTAKEDGKDAAATTAAVDSKDRAETKAPDKDKAAITAIGKDTKTDVKAISDTKETASDGTKQAPKDAPKDATPGSAAAGTQGASGETLTGIKPAKDVENPKDSTKEDKALTAAVIKDNTDKPAKPKVPTASTTEHGTVSAQGTVRGPISQSTTGHPAASASGSQNPAGKTPDAQTQGAEPKSSETKTSETKASVTKPSESKSSGSKPPSASTAHDSASKSTGSASGSSKSGGDGSKSSGGGHD
ncbi:Uncharacterised protein [Mycolicibacterium phlei]|uniref:hypothetical protein n=1 Tax=Mycobacteroides chelonae TaxID=1774 RepID=UPI000618A778|nr:hypothetical protein [Mycobacteroides chelonae]VEG17212.1 Uncharacterised protein [Mycolicibacterium phlei]AKC39218.1 hypothetical protein GR01_12565 [Mycobacteroides chelonae]ANA98645.1 hypothetical protein BB28_13370 [Mycobacteroides chelonae CCUG 47445]OLT72409.1 hypothetical protein BKG56_20500 [Mycobacteroides chelonae]ORV11733.1 hypothetical protein AWB96_20420 [Mycobacteroides chelonae]